MKFLSNEKSYYLLILNIIYSKGNKYAQFSKRKQKQFSWIRDVIHVCPT